MCFKYFSVDQHSYARSAKHPANQCAFFKIFLFFLLCFLKIFLRNGLIFIFGNLHADCPENIDTFLPFCFFFLPDQECSHLFIVRFITNLIQKCIYIIFHVNLRSITHISYLAYIFWKFVFHNTLTSFCIFCSLGYRIIWKTLFLSLCVY